MKLMDSMRRPIGSGGFVAQIDGLRFFAILPVVLDHAWWTYSTNIGSPGFDIDSPLGHLFSAGESGVQLFFVISGYVLGLGFFHAAKEIRGVGLGGYFKRRLRRLEPPYIVVMTAFFLVLLLSGQFDFFDGLGHYLASITYLHSLIYLEPSAINTVTWSLEVELQFYVLAPILYSVYRLPKRAALAVIAAGVLFFIATAFFIGDFYLTLFSHGHLFLLGAAFPILGRFHISSKLAFLFPLALISYFLVETDYASVSGNVIKVLLLSIVFATTLRCDPVRRFLSTPFLFIIGGACYSIYLIHYPLLSALSKIWASLVIPGGFSAFLVFAVSVVLLVCMLFFVVAERPFMTRMGSQKSAKI